MTHTRFGDGNGCVRAGRCLFGARFSRSPPNPSALSRVRADVVGQTGDRNRDIGSGCCGLQHQSRGPMIGGTQVSSLGRPTLQRGRTRRKDLPRPLIAWKEWEPQPFSQLSGRPQDFAGGHCSVLGEGESSRRFASQTPAASTPLTTAGHRSLLKNRFGVGKW